LDPARNRKWYGQKLDIDEAGEWRRLAIRQIQMVSFSIMTVLLSVLLGQGQQTVATNTHAVVPPLVNFAGVLTDLNGKPMTGVVGVTFYLYQEQQGGAPLWLETQNVQADDSGHYTVMLGSTSSYGLPADIFVAGQAHWLGVQVEGQAEQPRVLLVSAPYALKAGDAETIGGLPPSAFVLAVPSSATTSGAATSATAATAAAPQAPPPAGAVTGSGTADFIPLWTATSNLANSVLFQSGAGATARIGVNTSTPTTTLDVKGPGTVRGVLLLPAVGTATAAKGASSQPLALTASAFDSSSGAAVAQNFRWQAQPVGNNTSSPSGSLNLLYSSGTNAGTETGLQISSTGLFTFAPGQTFPGAGGGTITGVAAGTDLTGGGTTGSVTLNLDTTKIPQLAAANTFTANQMVNGTMTATSFSGNGSALTNVTASNSSELGGLAPTAFAQVGAANTFSGIQTFTNPNSSFTGSGAGLTGVVAVNSLELDGLGAGSFAQLGVNNPVTTVGTILSANDNGAALWVYQSGLGNGNPQSANGIQAYTSSTTGYGIIGANQATTGTAAGVLGTSASAGGVQGFGVGGYGVEGQSGFVGVYGVATGASNTGSVYGGFAGVWGDTNVEDETGILGTADFNSAGFFFNSSSVSPTLFVGNFGSGGGCYGCDVTLLEARGESTGKRCTIDGSGTLNCDGTVTAVVPTENGARKVSLYSVQSPENWFEDFGSGQLSNGFARVDLDSTFAQTVNTGQEYHVFLTPKGDCKGLYVSNERASSFEVHELGGGNSSVAFDYRITAKRSGYEKVRLTDVTEHYQKMEERDQRRMRALRHPALPSATPQVSPAAAPSRFSASAQALSDRAK
jgi:hypothetical protein